MISNKIVLVDWGVYLHKAVFASQKINMYPPYVCMTMLISDLQIIGIHPDDTVIICIDGRKNWRKELDPEYKSTRKKKRDDSGIDWDTLFKKFDELVAKLDKSTPFHIIKIHRLEADDIISVAVRHWDNRECIIVSHDSDYEQLFAFKNVQIFTPSKHKYKKPPKNPHAILEKKIKSERTDDLISPVTTEEQYKIRKTIVNLLELPDEIEKLVYERIENLQEKTDWDLSYFPFQKLSDRFIDIFNSQGVDIYKSMNNEEKKPPKKKNENNKQLTLM